MDALKEIRRYLATEGSLSARKLSETVADSHAYMHSLLKGRHTASYDIALKLAAIVFPDHADYEKRRSFTLSLMAGKPVPEPAEQVA